MTVGAKKSPQGGEAAEEAASTPSTRPGHSAPSSRIARFGADAAVAGHARTSTTQRAIAASGSSSTHASGESLVSKSTGRVVQLGHDQHPGFQTTRRGIPTSQEVKSLADLYTPWANVRVNGSGILAIAAWSKRLQDEGKDAIRQVGQDLEPFIRGLIHR